MDLFSKRTIPYAVMNETAPLTKIQKKTFIYKYSDKYKLGTIKIKERKTINQFAIKFNCLYLLNFNLARPERIELSTIP